MSIDDNSKDDLKVRPEDGGRRVEDGADEVEGGETIVQAAMNTDEVKIEVEVKPALKIGIALIILSVVVGYPLALVCGILFGAIWSGYCYVASWPIFLLGIAVGGRAGRDAVAHWRVRITHTVRNKLWRRKSD